MSDSSDEDPRIVILGDVLQMPYFVRNRKEIVRSMYENTSSSVSWSGELESL